MERLSCEKIMEMIKDEEKGIEEYEKYGLNKLAKEESKHKKFLKKLLRKC